MQDIRGALRHLVHHRGLSLAIVLTLALGIGANVLVFSVVRGVLLSPLPFAEPQQLVAVWETQPVMTGAGSRRPTSSPGARPAA